MCIVDVAGVPVLHFDPAIRDTYTDWLRSRNYAEKTISNYVDQLKVIDRQLGGIPLDELTAFRQVESLSTDTNYCRQKRRYVRNFLEYMHYAKGVECLDL